MEYVNLPCNSGLLQITSPGGRSVGSYTVRADVHAKGLPFCVVSGDMCYFRDDFLFLEMHASGDVQRPVVRLLGAGDGVAYLAHGAETDHCICRTMPLTWRTNLTYLMHATVAAARSRSRKVFGL